MKTEIKREFKILIFEWFGKMMFAEFKILKHNSSCSLLSRHMTLCHYIPMATPQVDPSVVTTSIWLSRYVSDLCSPEFPCLLRQASLCRDKSCVISNLP